MSARSKLVILTMAILTLSIGFYYVRYDPRSSFKTVDPILKIMQLDGNVGRFEDGVAVILTGKSIRIDDSAIDSIRGVERLSELSIFDAVITDASIGTIVDAYPQLRVLRLVNCSLVTDQSIVELAKLSKLKSLMISGSGLSTGGLERLRAVLPNCDIMDTVSTEELFLETDVGTLK
jgi:hypothetical protein